MSASPNHAALRRCSRSLRVRSGSNTSNTNHHALIAVALAIALGGLTWPRAAAAQWGYVSVSPDGGGGTLRPSPNSTGNNATFTVSTYVGGPATTYNLSCWYIAPVQSCTVPATVTVGQTTPQQVVVSYGVGTGTNY